MTSSAFDHKIAFGAHKLDQQVPRQHKEFGNTLSKNKWCEIDDTESNRKEDQMVIVNLNENKEIFTAYNGTKVWEAIY